MASSSTADVAVARALRPTGAWARNRDLLGELVRRDLRARYRGSNLGVLWSLINPLVYMAVYSVVFSTLMRFNIPGVKTYAVFLLPGLLAWNFFNQAVMGSVNSVLGNASIVKKVAFPWVLLTLSAVISAFVNYLISLLLLIPMVLIFQVPVGLPLLLMPVLAVVLFVMALGVGLLVGAGNVYFRDIEYLILIVLQVLFFVTPILYSLDLIIDRVEKSHNALAPAFRYLLYANPLTGIESAFQDVLAFNRWPSHWASFGYSVVISAAILALGIMVFSRLQGRFAEEL